MYWWHWLIVGFMFLCMIVFGTIAFFADISSNMDRHLYLKNNCQVIGKMKCKGDCSDLTGYRCSDGMEYWE